MVDKSNNVLSLCLVAKFDIISHRINKLTYRYTHKSEVFKLRYADKTYLYLKRACECHYCS